MNTKTTMTSNKPYLIRALYEWICDNQLTPYLLIDATNDQQLVVPKHYINDQKIVLNISHAAVRNLNMENEFILFNTRFQGRDFSITIPVTAVTAIYAKENGQGMLFPEQEPKADAPLDKQPKKPKKKKPQLKVVK